MLLRKCPEVPGPPVIDFAIRCVLAIIPAACAVQLIPFLPLVSESALWTVISAGGVGAVVYVLVLRWLRIDLMHFAADLRRLQ
jgi:hypothetical protein